MGHVTEPVEEAATRAAPAVPRWGSYVAIGDSFTEGLSDGPDSSGHYRGWADRLAQALSTRRRAAGLAPLQYANLAVRGRLLVPILTEQLPRALTAGPDLVSIAGGGNDLLRPGSDPDALAARLDRAVAEARSRGTDVLVATGMDTRNAGTLLRSIRPKVGIFNAHVWAIARRHGAYVLDVWGLRALQHRRMWAQDRIHMSTLGHQRTAQAALAALGLDPDDQHWHLPLRPEVLPRAEQIRDNVAWLRRDVLPWAGRRLRRTSSGVDRVPKRPELAALDEARSDDFPRPGPGDHEVRDS